jgi:hypothetical protein
MDGLGLSRGSPASRGDFPEERESEEGVENGAVGLGSEVNRKLRFNLGLLTIALLRE